MSGELIPVPTAASDPNLTPTQRFEMIVRAQPGMQEYHAPRETGESTTREQHQQLAVIEQSKYLGRAADQYGMVTSEAFVTADSRCGGVLCKGYQLPAGFKFHAQDTFEMLDIAAKIGAPKDMVFKFMVELGQRLKGK